MIDANYVLYHAHCGDGFGAAYAAWRVLGDRAKYIPVNYGEPFPVEVVNKDARILIVDFSYRRQILEDVRSKVADILVLDHHATAENELRGLAYAVFDMNRSGAGITWDYFHPDKPRSWLINMVEDRDLWRWKIPGTKETLAGMRFLVRDEFPEWLKVELEGPQKYLEVGKLVCAKEAADEDKIVEEARIAQFAGYTVPVVNTRWGRSEVCHKLCAKFNPPFAIAYFDVKDKRVYSLKRGHGEGIHLGELCKKFGGGGHPTAAGVEKPVDAESLIVELKQ